MKPTFIPQYSHDILKAKYKLNISDGPQQKLIDQKNSRNWINKQNRSTTSPRNFLNDTNHTNSKSQLEINKKVFNYSQNDTYSSIKDIRQTPIFSPVREDNQPSQNIQRSLSGYRTSIIPSSMRQTYNDNPESSPVLFKPVLYPNSHTDFNKIQK